MPRLNCGVIRPSARRRMTEPPKYSQTEIERRWLVDLSGVDLKFAPCRDIDDLYIADSRLRVRKISGPNELTFKLGKKYGKSTTLSEPITNLYLTEGEYQRLLALPGHRARKRRYTLRLGSLDVYVDPHAGLAVLEVEFASEQSAKEFMPPHFVTREITNDTEFSGASLAEHRGTV
jgi:CYTH domain-containing protein